MSFCVANAKGSLISSHDTKNRDREDYLRLSYAPEQNQIFEPEINPNTEKMQMQRDC